jgi:hypothetical protein
MSDRDPADDPLKDGAGKLVETLTDKELEAELTIALRDEERREKRYKHLVRELRKRRPLSAK